MIPCKIVSNLSNSFQTDVILF